LITLNRVLDATTRWGAVLVLPLIALLFLQWPLRDVVAAGSRQANDAAQWLFALYVALAIAHTSRRGGHMSAAAFAARYPPRIRSAIARFGEPLCVLPWSLFVLFSAAAPTWRSLRSLESFPDTSNPLYFVVKCSVVLLAVLLTLRSLADMVAPRRPADGAGA